MQQWPGQQVGPAQSQQPAQPRAPGIIQGPAPVVSPVEQERLANEQARIGLAQQAEQRQQEEQRREQERREAGFDATEGERKAGAFLIRALGANASFEGTGETARALPQQALRDAFPGFENYFIPGSRQVADSAQDEFIAASLRQDSGAAIPPEELERQRQIYFPVPGDGPEAIEQKRQARIRAILGLEQSAGRLGPSSRELFEKNFPDLAKPAPPAEEAPENKRQIEGVAFDPQQPVQGQYGDDGNGNPLLVLQGGKFFGQTTGQFEGEAAPAYVEFGGKYDDTINSAAYDMFNKTQSTIQFREGRVEGRGGFTDVAKGGLTLGLSDEAAGVGQAIGGALTGDFNVSENYSAGRAAEQYRIEQGRESMGAAALPVELLGAGGALRAGSAFGQVRGAVNSLRAAGQPVSRGAVQGALTRQATIEGAGIGALGGAAQGDTLQERGTNALVGGLTGGVLGRGGQMVSNRLANRAASAAPAGGVPSGAQAQQAADELGVDLIPSVTGGSVSQAVTAGARQGFVSDIPISRAVGRMEGQAEAARGRAAQAAGNAVDAEDAGELVRRGAQVYSQRTSQIGGRLYDRADRMANGVSFPLTNALRTARQELSTISRAPGGAESSIAKELRTLISQMGGRRVDVEGTRALRTRLRNEIMQRGLRGSPEDRIYQQILQSADEDMISGLRSAGRGDAARALETANNFWRTRVETIDQVLDPLIGKNAPRSGEQILAAVERLAKPDSGSAVNLGRLMRSMPRDEADSVRATIINRLGRPNPGGAEVERQGFSFNTFLTNWNNMTPRAKAALLPQESRRALDQLATISSRVKAAGGAANTSNTARALTVQAALSSGPLWFLDPLSALATSSTIAGGQYAIGRLLASPRFARLLAGAPRNATPAQRQAFNQRLSNLATQDPAIAREIGLYQRALVANDNNAVGSLAAEQENQTPSN